MPTPEVPRYQPRLSNERAAAGESGQARRGSRRKLRAYACRPGLVRRTSSILRRGCRPAGARGTAPDRRAQDRRRPPHQPGLQAYGAQFLLDHASAWPDSPAPPARSTTSAGISGPRAWAFSFSGTARRCRTAAVRAALARGGRGARMARRRVGSHRADAAGGGRAHLRRARPQGLPQSPGTARHGTAVYPGAEAGRAGLGPLGGDRPRARADHDRRRRVELLDELRGLPDSRVYAVVARQGRITAAPGAVSSG